MVHTSSRYFQVLLYDIKHTSCTTLVIFFKLLSFLKKTVAYKLLNGTTGTVKDIQRHQFTVFYSCSIICNTINCRITNEQFPAFDIVVRQCFFLLCPEMQQVFGGKMLVLLLHVICRDSGFVPQGKLILRLLHGNTTLTGFTW